MSVKILYISGYTCCNYKYAHSYEGNFTKEEFLTEDIKGKKIYLPQNNAKKIEILASLKKWWKDFYKY